KIAVSSRDRDVDPVGACVGIRGSRVQAVVQELRGEKIDIVPYNDDPARFVCNAIQPATVSRVLIDAERHTMELVVPDDKLSLAIGKKGQNVRLASRLTGWRIDIYSESKLRQMERRSLAEMAAIPGVGDVVASNLFQMGWRNLRDLAIADADELAQVPGIGTVDKAESIIEIANDAASGKLQLAVKYPEPASEDNRMVVDPNEDEGYAGGDA
ncbi:MAG: KH domain-containing protein, partial [Myxococcales bacterium]|nr:KH domain-containing protein [Myxococcales bacterium]